MAANSCLLYTSVFLPLIVVNCIILGRAEMFACKNSVVDSALDGIGMGIGYTLTVVLMATDVYKRQFLTVWPALLPP